MNLVNKKSQRDKHEDKQYQISNKKSLRLSEAF